MLDPNEPATIDSVEPLTVVGTGIKYLGAGIRYISESFQASGAMIINAHPFPPDLDPPMMDAIGAQVYTSCAHRLSPYTEFDLGLGRVGDAGGAWLGFQIHYHSGGREYVLVLHDKSILCGPDVADMCPPAPSVTAAPKSRVP